MCKSIVKPQNKTVFVSVANVNNRPIKLDRDTIIASLQSFDSSVPFEYNVPDTKDSHPEFPGHLSDMLEKSSEKLTDVQKQRFLAEYLNLEIFLLVLENS